MSWRPRLVALTTTALLLGALAVPTPAAAASITPGHVAPPASGTNAIGAGIDGANQNAQLGETLPATIVPSWRNAPAHCPSSGTVATKSIGVTRTSTIVFEAQFSCTSVSAYGTTTGTLLWRKQYGAAKSATVAGGKVFVVHTAVNTKTGAQTGRLDALSEQTGKKLWSTFRGGSVDWVVSAGSGLVANEHSVLSAATGRSKFDIPFPSEHGWTLIGGGRVFFANGAGVQAFDTSGRELWNLVYPKGVQAGSPDYNLNRVRPSLHDGLLYLPGAKTIVVGAKSGRLVRMIPRSEYSMAFDGKIGFVTSIGSTGTPATPSTVSAVGLKTGRVIWTHRLPMDSIFPTFPLAAPVVSNGIVWLSSASGSSDPASIVALDEVTGAQRSETIDPCTDGGHEGNLAVAQHRLFVATNCGVQTYVPTDAVPTSVTPGELLQDPGFERGTDAWGTIGAGTIARTPSPVHGGSGAVTITPDSTAPGAVGASRTITTDSIRIGGYRASCWVKPSTSGMSAAFRPAEWSADAPPTALPTGWDVEELAVGVWTRLSTQHTLWNNGKTIAMQVYSANASKTGGSLTVDDCSITGGPTH